MEKAIKNTKICFCALLTNKTAMRLFHHWTQMKTITKLEKPSDISSLFNFVTKQYFLLFGHITSYTQPVQHKQILKAMFVFFFFEEMKAH